MADWLDPEERDTWIALVAMVSTLQASLDAQLQRDHGISFFEYSVLAALSEQPDATIVMSELAGFAHGSLSRLSHGARRLEKQGFIRRERSPQDGRLTNAILTDVGRQKVADVAPSHVAHVRSLLFDHLSRPQAKSVRAAALTVLRQADPDLVPLLMARAGLRP